MFRFTIRDLLWLTAVVGLVCLLFAQTRTMNSYMFERNLLRERLRTCLQIQFSSARRRDIRAIIER